MERGFGHRLCVHLSVVCTQRLLNLYPVLQAQQGWVCILHLALHYVVVAPSQVFLREPFILRGILFWVGCHCDQEAME